MTTKVRYARMADLDALLEMWWKLHRFHVKNLKAKKDFRYVPDVRERMRKHYSKTVIPEKRILVTEENRVLTGFCEFGYSSRPPIYQNPRIIHIWCLYVEPPHRGKGIGKSLLKKLDGIRKRGQMKELEVSSHINNADAIAFYSSLGFRKRMVEMVRR